MSDTYASTNTNASIVTATLTIKSLRDYQNLPSIPPPLNFIYLPFRIVAFVCSCVFGAGGDIFKQGLVRRLTGCYVAKYWILAWSYLGGDEYEDEARRAKGKQKDEAETFQLMAKQNITKRQARESVVQRYVQKVEHAHTESYRERLKRIARDLHALCSRSRDVV